MEKKPCPVDRGKLLIGLEFCRRQAEGQCVNCPYWKNLCDIALMEDALAYINYLEELLNAKVDNPN